MRGFETILVLICASTGLAVLGRRVSIPVPIMLVFGGLVAALIPGVQVVEIDPALAFTIFVPPLLFRSAITTSLRGLRANLRSVTLLAVGLVIATALAVAAAAHHFFHLGWAPAFVLGAILAPPDAVIGISLARALRLSRRSITIIEGETLLNDTTAFILYAQAVVTEGEMWLTFGTHTQHLGVGDTFHVPLGTPHSEKYGPQGATYWVARRNAR
ncbi:MAG: hypothetical protein E6J62_08295 [Deltaproteobacteria bacterium]|nr:MAG: hypothetical protein E6J62_08295 [Deltaproteobacteria bacterium]